jgi:uncharacterized membrane protein YwaF
MSVLAPWPWYIAELAGMALVLILIFYAPFFIWDRGRNRSPATP